MNLERGKEEETEEFLRKQNGCEWKQGRESSGKNLKIHLLVLRVGVDPNPPTLFEG